MAIPSWASTGIALFLFVFVMSFIQGQVTYWVGRLVVEGTFKGRGKTKFFGAIANFFEGPVPQTGAKFLARWGLPVITLCYLTVGLQTAVIAGAGVLRVPWLRFTLFMVPGVAIKAVLWGTGLLVIWQSILYAAAGNPWAWLVLVVIIGCLVGFWWIRRRKAEISHLEDHPSGTT